MKTRSFGSLTLAIVSTVAGLGVAGCSTPAQSDATDSTNNNGGSNNSGTSSGSGSHSGSNGSNGNNGSSTRSGSGASNASNSNGNGSSQTGGGDAGTDATTSQSGCANGLALCDDFESDTVGQAPNPALWTLFGLGGCSGLGNPNATPVYSITVDDTQAHSGTKSVKIDTSMNTGPAGCGPFLVNTSAFSQLTADDLYGRFYVHLSDVTTATNHVALMALGLQTDGGVGFDVQTADSFLSMACEHDGFTSNSLCYQRSDGNGVIPAQNDVGTAETTYPAATGFTCIEFHTKASTGAIETWVNDTAVVGLTDPPAPSQVTKWILPSPLTVTSFGLGWSVYSGPNLTVWVDDVALSTSRIHCQ